ncbi:MAG TPA: AlkA N-terminal domain-containing protein [Pilimelia sp.]|nr:AlkA N-terminal domain-containing protein [Pilimelia sp.]
MDLDVERCYRAVHSRDQRFDGWFFTAVTTTGIYCRPSCPAVTPKRANVRFHPSAAAAQRAGFRACKRCRPDAVPGSPEWDTRADAVGRAVRLIADGVVDRDGVPGLARRLGYTERHLHRMLAAELGAGPLALARAQRAQTARILTETTELSLAEIAFAAGFGSVRQFNDTIREVYASPPTRLRADARHRPDAAPGTIALRLAYRPPLHAPGLLEFLAARAVPGVEEVDGDTYRRALRLPHGPATVALTPRPGHVATVLRLADVRDLAPAVARCRRLLDLDADPEAIDAALAADPAFTPTVTKDPGVRVPRAMDGFEAALRAIVGQQVSVRSAQSVLAHLTTALSPGDQGVGATDAGVSWHGSLDHPGGGRGFAAEGVLGLGDSAFRMPGGRRECIRAVARAVVDGELDLDPGADRAEAHRRLLALPGVGEWTAGYVALRAFGDPDAFLPTDLGVRHGAAALGLPAAPKQLAARAEAWRPWRAYAVVRLWAAATDHRRTA